MWSKCYYPCQNIAPLQGAYGYEYGIQGVPERINSYLWRVITFTKCNEIEQFNLKYNVQVIDYLVYENYMIWFNGLNDMLDCVTSGVKCFCPSFNIDNQTDISFKTQFKP